MTKRREEARARAKEKVLFIIGKLVSVLQIAASVVTVIFIRKAAFVPDKLLLLAAAVLAALAVVCLFLMKRKIRPVRFFIGLILAVLISAGLVYADLRIYELTHTLQTITDTREETTRVGVYVLEEDPAQSIEDMPGYTFGILETQARGGNG